MKVYAIQNIKTGLFLSEGKALKRTRAIFSNIPRLFIKKQSATAAMNAWALGVWHHSIDEYGEGEGPQPPNKIPEDRIKEDLKVVETEINF